MICAIAIFCTLSFAACAAEDTSVPVRPENPATKDKLYLEKARALGDRMTTVQCDDGFIATWWNKSHDFGWMNCNLASADALMELSLACGASTGSSVCVDAKVPAGNIVVEKIEGDTVFLHQDLRDTDQDWIYWKFRVTGAAGRTLHFRFTKSHAVGSRGAAVSTDRGKTWTWGDDLQPDKRREPKTNDHLDARAFGWTFGPKDDEVWFSQTIPYDVGDWRAFLDRHAVERGRLFEEGVLCKSRKGRNVEYARFGRLDGRAPYRIFVSSRHHCAETTATFVLEGLLEQVFAGDDLGSWLRENVEFRVVPFADKDGVVDGDQGKRRRPHDHARDYSDTRPVLYPEVRSIMAMLREWKPTVVNDFHCPWLRGTWFEKNNANEFIYQVGIAAPGFWVKQQDFGRTVERVQEAGFGYRQADDFRPGQGWNSASNWTQGMPLIHWAAGVFTNAALITTFEIPFANQRFKTLYPADFRAFGRDMALAYRTYLQDDDVKEFKYKTLHRMPSFTAAVTAEADPLKAKAVAGRLDVFDFGARGDGWTDDTAAIQAGLDYLAKRGGGKLYFPFTKRGYLVASPAKEFWSNGKIVRAQLVIPPGKHNIQLEGEMPCKLLYNYQVRFGENPQLGTTRFGENGNLNVAIHSTWEAPEERNPTNRPWAIIAAPEGTSCRGLFSVGIFSIKNLEFKAHLNKDKMYPTTSAANLQNVSRLIVEDSQFCLDEAVGDAATRKELQENPCHTVGLMGSGDQSDDQIFRNVAVQGFKYGFVFSEHTTAEHLYVHNCEYGVCSADATHPAILNRVLTQHCTRIFCALPDGTFGHRADWINLIVNENDYETGHGTLPEISRLRYGVWDPDNRMRGSITYLQGYPGNGQCFYPVLGGTNLTLRVLGKKEGN